MYRKKSFILENYGLLYKTYTALWQFKNANGKGDAGTVFQWSDCDTNDVVFTSFLKET